MRHTPIRSSTANRWNTRREEESKERRERRREKPRDDAAKGAVSSIACRARFPVGRPTGNSTIQADIHPRIQPQFFFLFLLLSLFFFFIIIYYFVLYFLFLCLAWWIFGHHASRRSSSGGSILNQALDSFRLPSLSSSKDSILFFSHQR